MDSLHIAKTLPLEDDLKLNRNRQMFISVLSLPITWVVLQSYQTWVARPVGLKILEVFPEIFEHLPIPVPVAFGAALTSLLIFGIIAVIWPQYGFGDAWKPQRAQSLIVAGLIVASFLYPVVNHVADYSTPVSRMGIVVWTLTPVAEEILFRGLLYALLVAFFQPPANASWQDMLPVIVLGAAWFSLWHVSPQAIHKYGWELIGLQAFLTFGAGLLFNGLRYWTGSIWWVIPVHAVGNLMISVM
jgi:membrane protease YdiL (CAAX protease family)